MVKDLSKELIFKMQNDFRYCGQVLKIAEAVSPQLIKLSPKLESVLGSQRFKDISQGIRIADNILNRGSAMTDKGAEIIAPPSDESPRQTI